MEVRLRTSLRALRGPSTTRGCSPAARPRPARGGPLGFELHLSSPQRGAYTVVTEPLRKAPSAAWSELGGRLGGLQGCLRLRHQLRRHQACAQTHLPITSRSSTASANVSAGLCGGPCARTWYSSWTPCSLSCSCWACGDATATIFGFSFRNVTTWGKPSLFAAVPGPYVMFTGSTTLLRTGLRVRPSRIREA